MELGGPGGISFRRKAAASDQIKAHVIDWLAEQAASPGHGNVADSIAGELVTASPARFCLWTRMQAASESYVRN